LILVDLFNQINTRWRKTTSARKLLGHIALAVSTRPGERVSNSGKVRPEGRGPKEIGIRRRVGADDGAGLLHGGHPYRGARAPGARRDLVAKLRAARERKIAAGGRGSGRFTYAIKVPQTVALAKELHGEVMTLRKICAALAERGHLTSGGKPYGPNAVMKMLASD
jgi:hypothetical protein